MTPPPPDPLTAARARLTAAFTATEVREHLLTVFQLLQEAASAEYGEKLGEALNQLMGVLGSNRQDTLGALLAYETALLDTVRAERHTEVDLVRKELDALRAERRTAGAELDRRLRGLEAWTYQGDIGNGSAVAHIPPPGHDDPSEGHP